MLGPSGVRVDSRSLPIYPRIAGVEVYYPILAIAIAVNAALLFVFLRRDGFVIRPIFLYVAALAVCGMAGAKLCSIFLRGGPDTLAYELAGGYRYPGAILGILLAAFALRRFLPTELTFGRFFDAWTPGFALALALGRVGCLLNGCCHGAVCALPWALVYPASSIAWQATMGAGAIPWNATVSAPVHPLPLYLLSLELVLFVLCLGWRKTKRYDGQVLLRFLAVHGPVKAALEFFRFDYHPLHQIVFPIGLVAGGILLVRWIQDRRNRLAPVGSVAGA